MAKFIDALHSGRVLLMDGAMGTELQRVGLREGECGALWNVSRPEAVRAVHKAYVQAGAACLLTNTFQSNPHALARYGLTDRLVELNRAAVRLARDAVGPDGFVLGDIGPVGDGRDTAAYEATARSLDGVDALLLETVSDQHALWLARYAVGPIAAELQVPGLLSVTYLKTGRGVLTATDGQPPGTFGRLARQYGVAALGVNCGRDIGMDDVIEVIRRCREVTEVPLFARPNAGTPRRSENGWEYPHSPAAMADRLPELLEAGVQMVGGCCGTTPAHIAAFGRVVDAWNARGRGEGI